MARRNTEERRVSHIEFVSAGLLNDVDIEITNSRFMRWSYPNSNQEITVYAMDAKVEGQDDVTELTWSVGGDDDFMPSKDGMYLIADGDRSSLAKNSKYQALMTSLQGLGLEGDHLESFGESADYLDGAKVHIMRVPYKGFSGAGRSSGGSRRRGESEDGEKRENEVVVVTEIHSWPWEKGGKKSGSSSKSTKSSRKAKDEDDEPEEKPSRGSRSKASDDGDDLESIAEKAVKAALAKNAGEMDQDDLVVDVYQNRLPEDLDKPTRKKVMDLVNDKKFLSGIKGVEVDGDKVSM